MTFTESTIEQASIEWQEETQNVFTVICRHVWQVSLATHGACPPRKPLGSERLLARVWDGVSMLRVMG